MFTDIVICEIVGVSFLPPLIAKPHLKELGLIRIWPYGRINIVQLTVKYFTFWSRHRFTTQCKAHLTYTYINCWSQKERFWLSSLPLTGAWSSQWSKDCEFATCTHVWDSCHWNNWAETLFSQGISFLFTFSLLWVLIPVTCCLLPYCNS